MFHKAMYYLPYHLKEIFLTINKMHFIQLSNNRMIILPGLFSFP